MSTVTTYVMLVLSSVSFIALNNCSKRSDAGYEQAESKEQSVEAADYAILAPPLGYPTGGIFLGSLVPVEIDCNDGTDDDGDGLVDCMDNDCHVHPECSEFGPPLEELVNGRALSVYPNGLLVPEDYVILNTRGADDDDAHGWQRDNFFATSQKDCWIDPRNQDPYNFIPLGEPLIASPDGPVGPQLFPDRVLPVFGPRRGLIEECEFGTDLMFHHTDDDNGAGAGASGDTDDDDGGSGPHTPAVDGEGDEDDQE